MTLVVTHPFVSPKPQGGDSTRVYGPQWNANHTIVGTADGTQLNANVVQAVVNDTNIQGSIASQTLTFSWGGTLAAARLNANVVQAITNDTNVTGTISAQNLTLGWTGQLGLARGGTNANLSATGGASQVLKQVSSGAAVTVGQLAFTDISGTASAAQLPNPTASTLGGVESYAAVSHQWINTISTSGVPSSTQPAFTDISGSLPNSQLATMAAWTFKVNNTSGTATPTDITIDGLTVKASPAAGDEVMIWDVAGTAIKKATVSSLTAASGVSSIAGNTGAFTLSTGITNSTNDIRLVVPVTAANGGTGVISPAAHTIPINAGASAQNNTGTGTAGQALISNGASVDPSFIGGCHVLLNTLTPSGVASVQDTTSLTSTYNDYEIVFENVVCATAASNLMLQAQVSGTFQSTGYLSNILFSNNATPGAAQITTFIPCGNDGFAVAAPGINGTLRVHNPSGTTAPKIFFGMSTCVTSSLGVIIMGMGAYTAANAAVTGFKILTSSGNITSGTIKIYGIL